MMWFIAYYCPNLVIIYGFGQFTSTANNYNHPFVAILREFQLGTLFVFSVPHVKKMQAFFFTSKLLQIIHEIYDIPNGDAVFFNYWIYLR